MAKKVVKMYAEWCGPCKILGRRLDKMQLGDRLISVNSDSKSDEPEKLGFPRPKALPTLYIINDNNEILETIEGLATPEAILKALEN